MFIFLKRGVSPFSSNASFKSWNCKTSCSHKAQSFACSWTIASGLLHNLSKVRCPTLQVVAKVGDANGDRHEGFLLWEKAALSQVYFPRETQIAWWPKYLCNKSKTLRHSSSAWIVQLELSLRFKRPNKLYYRDQLDSITDVNTSWRESSLCEIIWQF